jgi:hypothetical protein
MSKLHWVVLQVLSIVVFAQVVTASANDGSVPASAASSDAPSLAAEPSVASAPAIVSEAPSLNLEHFASIEPSRAPVSLAPTVPAGELPPVDGQVQQTVSVVGEALRHGWSLPLILILVSTITYLITAVLKARKILTSSKGILTCTVIAGVFFGVGSLMVAGATLPSALILTLAGPGAIPIHKLLKTYLNIDLGTQRGA